jgi:excisionase family DNA binding protein
MMNTYLPPEDDDEPDEEEPSASPYMTTAEAAEFLRCSNSYLEKLRVNGGGPRFVGLSGGKVLYKRKDLIAWADGRRFRATCEFRQTAGPRKTCRRKKPAATLAESGSSGEGSVPDGDAGNVTGRKEDREDDA